MIIYTLYCFVSEECYFVINRCPEQVMLCVLPNVDASDLSINIQHKLIEAYCWENSVNVVKVGLHGHFSAIRIVYCQQSRTKYEKIRI